MLSPLRSETPSPHWTGVFNAWLSWHGPGDTSKAHLPSLTLSTVPSIRFQRQPGHRHVLRHSTESSRLGQRPVNDQLSMDNPTTLRYSRLSWHDHCD
jgi:hypothetical protein